MNNEYSIHHYTTTKLLLYPNALCMIFTILLTLLNSEQKNGLLTKLFCFASDFDETWWSWCTTISISFIKIGWKIKKVLLIARFSVQNFKVSVELWKSYIVRLTNIWVVVLFMDLPLSTWKRSLYLNHKHFLTCD